ncbi:hypothetical protein [Kitasatospora sp. NPDC085464]|uniref:hypothetical protein n=1 Tax=Kitasatospora sp. NPDC085464 TaxID=3364063 RepID=UPI0037C8F35C
MLRNEETDRQRPSINDTLAAFHAPSQGTAARRQPLAAAEHSGWRALPLPMKAAAGLVVGTWTAARWSVQQWRATLPMYASGAVWGAAVLGHGEHVSPGLAVAGAAASALGGGWWVRTAAPPRRLLGGAVVLWAGTWTWLGVALADGPTERPLPALFAIGAVGTVGTFGWLEARRRALTPQGEEDDGVEVVQDEPAKAPPVVVDQDGNPVTGGDQHQVWEEFVSNPGGPLPGAELVEVTVTANGWSGVILLPRGRASLATAHAAADRIASAYDVPEVSVSIDSTSSGSSRRAQLSIFEHDPLATSQPWDGPGLLDPATGIAPIGTYQDLLPTRYRMWRPGSGPVHDLISGTTDSGKSSLVSMLLAYERHSQHMLSFVGDPQGGQSLPDWQDEVHWFADDPDEILGMMQAAVALMYDRSRRLATLEWYDQHGRVRRGVSAFDPVTLGMPIFSTTIEEAHKVLKINSEMVRATEEFGAMSRKCGGRLRVVTPVPTLDTMGHSTLLREMVASGNVIVFRTGGPSSGQAAFNGTLPVQPHLLKKEWPDGSSTAGLGFAHVPGARRGAFRTFQVEDPYHWASTGHLTEIQAEDELALGEMFGTWRERRADRRLGRVRVPVNVQLTKPPAAPPVLVPAGTVPGVPAGGEEAARAEAALITPKAGLRSSARADLLAALRTDVDRVWTNAELMEMTGLTNAKTVSSALTRLADDKLVIKHGTGQWQGVARSPEFAMA